MVVEEGSNEKKKIERLKELREAEEKIQWHMLRQDEKIVWASISTLHPAYLYAQYPLIT